MASELKIGVIGAGRIGRLHIGHIVQRISGATVSAVSDVYKEAAEAAAALYGISKVYTDAGELIKDSDVDAVVICSSTDTHAPFMKAAAGEGKDIFCEKPIALELNDIDDALSEVERRGVRLQIGFNRRFDANYRRVWEHVHTGRIGQPELLRITSRDPGPPPIEYIKVSGGIFIDMMIHDFDMARYLIGAEPAEIYAVGGVLVDPQIGEAGDVDTAIVTITFDNGVLGTIDNSRRAIFGYDQRVEVLGSKGMSAIDNSYPNTATLSTGETVSRDLPLNFFMERYVESYVTELQQFVECVQSGSQTPVTGLDGRIPIVMGKAAGRSLQERRPVAVSEIG